MNVCIVTVYNTENCGSFWQSIALASVVEKSGHNVYFLNRDLNDTSQSVKTRFTTSVKKCLKLEFTTSLLLWKRYFNYKKAQKSFKVIKKDSPEFKNIDLFIIGSDTVWNFDSNYFMRHSDVYSGRCLGAEKCITYAASAANTPYEKFDIPEISVPISKLKAISVRDEETYNIAKKLTGREVSIVCDPTMLAERVLFDEHEKEIFDNNYILLYHFAPIGENTKREILALKKKHNLKVISFGEHRTWCDKTVPYDPYAFVSYFKNASFVVTDTFHGTIFSILYEKSFVEYGNKKKKISDLLKSLQLTDAVRENRKSVAEIYENGLDYTYANEKIKELRAESMLYLQENLSEN